ncbi:MAG TPA: hypothetical protein PKD86_00120 [Gemmatales bacterium]|nr:hypothetical protein [Gemmatales bacterium]
MTISERQKFVVRAALIYALSNLDDINDAFADDPDDGTCAIRVGGEIGSLIEEGEVQSLIDHFEPTTHAAPTGLHAFKGTIIVAIDPSEADVGEQPVTLDDVSDFFKAALVLNIDNEEHGNPVGFQSAEFLCDTLEELPQDTVRLLYGR